MEWFGRNNFLGPSEKEFPSSSSPNWISLDGLRMSEIWIKNTSYGDGPGPMSNC